MREFENNNGIMMIGGKSTVEIANEFGTPVYIIDEDRLRDNYRNIYGAFSKYINTEVRYACKANSNLTILKILEQEGSGISASSIGEIMSCLKTGFDPNKIIYTGVNTSNQELKDVADLGVMIDLDSISKMERLAEISPCHDVSFRIATGIHNGHNSKVITESKGSKLGIPMSDVINTYARAKDLGFNIRGIHACANSSGLDIEPFIDIAYILTELVNEIKGLGINLDFIDIGGGIGVPYRPQEKEIDINELAMNITDIITEETDVNKIILEPGKYITCDTTILLTTINDIKNIGIKKYLGCDVGFNELIGPAMCDQYHHIAIANKFGMACTDRYDVVGPICEQEDYFAKNRVLPNPVEGDIIAIYNVGAYGFSMQSNYNSRPLCGEVIVNNGDVEIIRESEGMEDIWKHQIIPKRFL